MLAALNVFPAPWKMKTNHIRWFNNKHQEINSTSGTRITAKTNGELIIEKVQLSDGGTYECRGLEYTRYYTIYVNGTVGQLIFTSSQVVWSFGLSMVSLSVILYLRVI